MAITPALDNLNKGDAPSLALVHPTEAEKQIQFNLNGSEWRGALSLPAYLRREATLSQQTLTRDGGISYWILVDTSLPNNPLDPDSGTRLPLASCETYRKKALVWQNGELKEVICHGIGSVFCANHLRKRGYAQRMMTELGKALKTYQTEDDQECLFSILYSDIGKVHSSDLLRRYTANKNRNFTIPSAGNLLLRHTFLFLRPLLRTQAAYPMPVHCTQQIWRSCARST
jgi:hypothetical protein